MLPLPDVLVGDAVVADDLLRLFRNGSRASSSAPEQPAYSAASRATDDAVARFEDWEDWDTSSPFWKHAVAGSCAGVMEHIAMYPLDTVKTHMQALRPDGSLPLRVSDVVRNIFQESGGSGFMRGCTAIATGCIPAHVALFTTYEALRAKLLTPTVDGIPPVHEPVRAGICGAVSTACHDVILTPCDLVKQRMQLGQYTGIAHCLRHICSSEGSAALFRSLPTTMVMNVPFGSVFVAANESIKSILGCDRSHRGVQFYFLSAGMSGALACAVTQPLDTVKTRLQTQDCLVRRYAPSEGVVAAGAFGLDGQALAPKYAGLVPTLRALLREEGARVFFRGMFPRMLHTIPASAVCWGTYETIKTTLGA